MSLLVVMAMMLAGCRAPTPTPHRRLRLPPAPPPEATPTPPPPPEKRVLRITFSWPTYIDPAVGSDFSSSSSLCNLYDTLVFPTTGGVEPHVAKSWELSDDGLTWTFHLKKGIKFHNGSELTASDVAFSMNRMLEITTAHLAEAIQSLSGLWVTFRVGCR